MEDSRPDVHGLTAGDRMLLAGVLAVFGVMWVVYGGAMLAAWVSGRGPLGVNASDTLSTFVALRSHMSDPAQAWRSPAADRLPGAPLYWLCTAAAAVPLGLVGWLWWEFRSAHRVGLATRMRLGVDTEARMATLEDIAPLVVTEARRGRLMLGRVHGRLVAAEAPPTRPTSAGTALGTARYRPARGSVMLMGPSQSGKTTCAISGILEWDGPALLSSVKTDLLNETFGWRTTKGTCQVFDPSGITGRPAATWTPLRAAATFDGAQAAARALTDCAPASDSGESQFWYQESEFILTGYMWVAARSGLGMGDVVRWILTQDSPTVNDTGDEQPGEVQALLDGFLGSNDTAVAGEAEAINNLLTAVWMLEDKMRSGIFGSAQAAIWPWTNPRVVGSSTSCEITLDSLLAGTNTVYVSAPNRAAERLAPALGGLISDILDQVAERVARTGKPLDPPLLLVLDEVGNTPLRGLPELVATMSGLGVQIVTIWQNVAQIRAAYRDKAGTIVANHRTKVFFSGISDPDTFEMVMRQVGDEQVVSRQLTSEVSVGVDPGRRSLAESTVTTSLIPAHVLRQQVTGSALLIHGTIPPAHLTTRSYFDDPELFRRATCS